MLNQDTMAFYTSNPEVDEFDGDPKFAQLEFRASTVKRRRTPANWAIMYGDRDFEKLGIPVPEKKEELPHFYVIPPRGIERNNRGNGVVVSRDEDVELCEAMVRDVLGDAVRVDMGMLKALVPKMWGWLNDGSVSFYRSDIYHFKLLQMAFGFVQFNPDRLRDVMRCLWNLFRTGNIPPVQALSFGAFLLRGGVDSEFYLDLICPEDADIRNIRHLMEKVKLEGFDDTWRFMWYELHEHLGAFLAPLLKREQFSDLFVAVGSLGIPSIGRRLLDDNYFRIELPFCPLGEVYSVMKNAVDDGIRATTKRLDGMRRAEAAGNNYYRMNCQFCDFAGTCAMLRAHIKAPHSQEFLLTCGFCGMPWKAEDSLTLEECDMIGFWDHQIYCPRLVPMYDVKYRTQKVFRAPEGLSGRGKNLKEAMYGSEAIELDIDYVLCGSFPKQVIFGWKLPGHL